MYLLLDGVVFVKIFHFQQYQIYLLFILLEVLALLIKYCYQQDQKISQLNQEVIKLRSIELEGMHKDTLIQQLHQEIADLRVYHLLLKTNI